MYKITTLKEVKSLVDKTKPLFCDTETCGFYNKIRLIQFNQEGWEEVLLVEWPNAYELAVLVGVEYHTVWHNAHYDVTTIQQQTNSSFIPLKLDDTFLLSRLAQPEYLTYSLDDVTARVIGEDPYEKFGLNKKELQKSNWSSLSLTKEQLLYAALDVKYMPEVWKDVSKAKETQSYILDMYSLKHALGFQWNGLPIQQSRLDKKYKEYTEKLSNVDIPINSNSWQQVRKWLNVDKSDKNFLSSLAIQGNEKAKAVLDSRKYKKRLSFMDKYYKSGERLYGKFKPSARSGRFTSDDENLQQIPRDLKDVFGYEEDEGRVLIYSDYAQIELRSICAILGVSIMEKLFREGVDVHGYVAEILFGKDWTKDDRQVTKTYNFNLLYGGSANIVVAILITYGYLLDIKTANRHKRKWLNIFKEIASWQERETRAWRKGKLGVTPLGREYKSKLMTDHMNIKNQGAGAEVAKLAMHYFMPWLKEFNKSNNTNVKLCNFVHDSFILDAPNDKEIYEPVSIKLAECMQESWFEMSKLFKVKDLPMPVNVLVGYNWGDIENDKIDNLFEFELEPFKMLGKVK